MSLLISAYIADLIFGDPEWFPHPVRAIGGLVSLLDDKLRGRSSRLVERSKGIISACAVIAISCLCAYLFLEFFRKCNPALGNLAWIYLGYTTLSIKDLQVKAKAVLQGLRRGDIRKARRRLAQIVGRDTRDLDQEEITKAAIESVAENTNDGIIAPLFYLILGGPVLAVGYKAVNTLDSLLGYKNEKYLDFGWFAARLDDVMNYLPARLAGLLIAIASFILGKDSGSSLRIMHRDGRKHPSPNSGITEAAMAGALGISLGGPVRYQGRLCNKPYLGGNKRKALPGLIKEALGISFVSSLLMISLGILVKWAI